MHNFIGQSIGRYHILEQLGEGGMAIVFKAFDTRLECEVAIKFIRVEMLSPDISAKALKRFEREAKAVAQLTHPFIVKVTDYGEFENVPYLVMPYLPGGTLKQMTGNAMPYTQAARLLVPIAGALEYAHSQKILHRDVKPSNILITQDGQPMLTDFGVAKILDASEGQTLTGTGVGIGTPEYMAPEQAMGRDVDVRADIYALGIVFYELVTGRKPFTADTPMAVVLKQFTEPIPRPKIFVPNLPDSVERVLFKALAKQPEDRYLTMKDFANALEMLAQGQPASNLQQPAPVKAIPSTKSTGTIESIRDDVQSTLEYKQTGQPLTITETMDFGPKKNEVPPRRAALWKWAAGGAALLVLLAVGYLLVTGNKQPGEKTAATATNAGVVSAVTAPPKKATAPPAATAAPTYGIGATKRSEVDLMVLKYVPAGEFAMGSTTGSGGSTYQLYLDAFWMDKTEVTNDQYMKCVSAGKCAAPSSNSSATRTAYFNSPMYANYPVIYIFAEDAKNYCSWAGRRLPSEAEWEKAARGSKTANKYPWGEHDPSCAFANFNLFVCGGDTKEGGKSPNGTSPYGIVDLAGNVWEWVDRTNGIVGNYALSGGSFKSPADELQVINRRLLTADKVSSFQSEDVGFRCVVSQ